MTPKSLLRLPQATNRIEHLTDGQFFPVLGEPRVDRRQGRALCSVHRQDLLRPHRPTHARGRRTGRRRPRRAALPLPAGRDPRARRVLPEPARGRLGAGGAAQHGRARAHVTAPDADPARAPRVRLHRPARARQPGRGLPGRAHQRAEPDPRARRSTSSSRCRCTPARNRASAKSASASDAALQRGGAGARAAAGRRSSSSRQPGRSSKAWPARATRVARSPACAAASAAQKSSSWLSGARSRRLRVAAPAASSVAPRRRGRRPGGQVVGVVRGRAAARARRSGSGWSSTRKVDCGAPGRARGGDDEQRRGLAAAHVAARRLGRLERRQQPPGEGAGPRPRRRGHRGQTVGAAIMLAWQETPAADRWPAYGDAAGAGVRADPPARVDDGDLAHVARLVGGQHRGERVRRGAARREPVERARAVGRLGDRLRRRPRRRPVAPTARSGRRRTSATARPRRARRSPRRGRRSSRYRVASGDATLAPHGARAVLDRVRAIPPGFVRTYGDVSPGAPRFAGLVLSHCDDPTVPWFRDRAGGRLARQGRAPARAARGRRRPVQAASASTCGRHACRTSLGAMWIQP